MEKMNAVQTDDSEVVRKHILNPHNHTVTLLETFIRIPFQSTL